ncbi:MAG: RagB/SusD family nutrient uptake outer membrane protein [Bacteroidales bacterium]|nr:RagB/SusD family nutrient uptake outer membrane protein [Bacteroidales bacterium]
MKRINILLTALALIFATSCESFLDVKPSNQVDSGSSIQNVSDAKIMVQGLMNKLTSSNYYGRNFLIYGDAKGGDLTIYSAGNGGDAWYYFTHEQSSNSYIGYWSTMYNCLLQANNIIKNIYSLKEGGATGLDDYLGQALTIRALIHFDLVRLYGKPYNMDKNAYGVPVVTEPIDASAQLLRNTVEEVYTQVVKDLKDAAPLLGKKANNGFINYYANQAILSKVYMYMDNFSEALTVAEGIINSGVYTPYTASNWTASWARTFGSESIFELNVLVNEGDLGTGSPGCYYRRRAHGISAGGVFLASQYWFDIMGANDARWGIMDSDQSDEEDGTGRKGSCYKYSGSTTLSGDGKENATAVNIKVIRLSEVLLNAAEAAVRTNNQAKALEYLSPVASRNPDWVAPATITLEDIMTERRREFLTEGIVFFEQMRMDMTVYYEDDAFQKGTNPPASGRGQLRTTVNGVEQCPVTRNFFKTILPIGQDEINANPGIEAQQNPGY